MKKYILDIIEKKPLFASSIIVLICAFFSTGFLHPDEHYQILELINLKLNNNYTDHSIFNWDYSLMIRSWFQPAFYYLFLKPFFFLDPFQKAFLIRLLNGLIALYAFSQIFKASQHRVLTLVLIWFIPFFLVRTNSESLSTSLFLIGAPYFIKNTNKNSLISGLFFGLSFLVRYQMGVVIFCVNLWSLIKKRNILNLSIHTLSVLFVIALGSLIDWWGYGELTFAPYNYFRENIINSRASDFGTSPFWYYLTEPLLKGIPFIAIFIYYSLYKYVKEYKLDFYVCAFLSFLIIHSLVPHKELRFLVFNYVLAAMALSYFYSKFQTKKWIKNIILTFNFLLLAKVLLLPAAKEIDLYKIIYNNKIRTLQVLDQGPSKFEFTMPYYQRSKIKTFTSSEISSPYVLATKWSQYKSNQEKLKKCQLLHHSYPMWIEKLNFFKWLDRSSMFLLWHCQ